MVYAFQIYLIWKINLNVYLILRFIQFSYHHEDQISKPYDPVLNIFPSKSASTCYLQKLIFTILKQEVEKSIFIYD